MLPRTLSIIVFVLSVLCGAILLLRSPVAFDEPHHVSVSKEQQEQRMQSLSSRILSRLSIFPLFQARKEPIAVMIENHEDARPYHAGLTEALLVHEFLVEGFISRFVAIFDARKLPREIGPVRSLRPYFLDTIFPWARTVFHAGGSPESLTRVQNSGEFYALNLLYFDGEQDSLRKEGAVAPHNLFLQKRFLKGLLEDVPESRIRPMQWPPFSTGFPQAPSEPADIIQVNFFSALHNVTFEYLPLAEKYRRTNGGTVSHARPSTIIVLEVPIISIGEYGRLNMDLIGSGPANVFHSGRMWTGQWRRSSLSESPKIYDTDGNELPIHNGLIWMMTLPTLERVSVKTLEESAEL